jgi:glycosyltransferase involved in cell wall biosynthesis
MSACPFSLLLPVYGRDQAAFLERSLRSAVTEQVRPPDEVVLVQDGPVGPDLRRVIDRFRVQAAVPVTVVDLQHNLGLGRALDVGLAACRYDIVARQDADDISAPRRFATLVPLIEWGDDLVGSGLLEFGRDETDVVGQRTPPTDPAAIARYARFHSPFNHPSVVYRRSAVRAVGGYEDLPLLEDYWLFVRMIEHGARVRNVAEPLVLYRVGSGAFARRGGSRLLRSEVELQRRMHRLGFTTTAEYARNLLVRGGYRLVPERARRSAYRRVFGVGSSASVGPGQVGTLDADVTSSQRLDW